LPVLSIVFSSLFYYYFIESLDNNNYENIFDSESNSDIKRGSNQGDTSTDSS
jgi:hypothetical protein